MCMVVFFVREKASVAIVAADSKRSFWAAWTVMNNCRSQFGWQCAQLKESGPHRAGSPDVGSAAASYSGAGTDGATSTASRLLFSGLPSEVSSSPAVVVTKKLRILLVPATALSSRRFFSRFFAAPEIYKRGRLSDGYITMKLN